MKYVSHLDGFRALCVISVFLYHSMLFDAGWVGVQAFFVLSGFLITGVLLEAKEAQAPAGSFFRNFYARRALRIMPVYFAFIAVVVLAGFAGIGGPQVSAQVRAHNAEHLPYLLTYTYNFFQTNLARGSPFYGPLWSLSVEEQFYLLWPLAVFVLARNGLSRLCLLLVLAGPLVRGAEMLLLQQLPSMRNPPEKVVYFLTFSHLDAFALGALLNFRKENALAGWLAKLPGRTALLGMLLASALLLLAAKRAHLGLAFTSFGWPLYMGNFQAPIWGYSLLNIAFFVAISKAGSIALLGSRPLRRLGVVSYGFYIFHLPTIWVVEALTHAQPGRLSLENLLITSTSFALSWGLAELSYRGLEAPLLRLKTRFATAKAPAADAAGEGQQLSAALRAAPAPD